MACRKNVKDLTVQEKQAFVAAVKALKSNGKYNQYVRQHMDAMMHATPPSGSPNVRNAAHRGPAFLPWHREFLRRFEKDLQAAVPGVALPYWDWASDAALADPASGVVWNNDLMGGNGDAGDNDYVKTGPFAFDPMDAGTWTVADEDGNDTGDGLQRTFGQETTSLPPQAHVTTIQGLTPYDQSPWNRDSGGYRNNNEGWATVGGNPPPNTHNRVHVWVGGSMLPGTSPNDPVFFLHHCFVDKLWADWQALHPGEVYVPSPGESSDLDGHRLDDAMYPWSTTPADVLDHRGLGYVFDTDPDEVDLDTPALVFNDVHEGETTVRAAVFSISACGTIHLEVTDGPNLLSGPPQSQLGTPLGATVTVPPAADSTPRKGRVWISFTGTNAGDVATGDVTIRCSETGEEWLVPISANTIARPTVATVLVLDQSGSMDYDAGDGRKRIQVLHESAPVFVDLLREDDGVGVVRFDHDAYPGTPIAPAGPYPFGAGRAAAKAAISGVMPNPAGSTSIGDGIDLARSDLDGPAAAGYDETAIIVLTDGRENSSQYISDIADLIDDRVFGIGLGTAEQINPVALNQLTDGTGGYVLMTGVLDTDDYFILQKYYLQILAGVTNADIVLDPEGRLKPGDVHRIPFQLNEADITCDVILLTATVPPQTFRVVVETPSGARIDPVSVSTIPGAQFAMGSHASFYRLTLPVPAAGFEEREGTWHAVLELDPRYYKRYLTTLEEGTSEFISTVTHGVRYSLSVHSTSSLRMRSHLTQDRQTPGATLTLRARLEQFGLPLDNLAAVRAELVRPDASTATLPLTEVDPGVFETSIPANLSGIYRFRILAAGHSLRSRPFTREQLLTGAVWRGGDAPPPTGDDDPGDGTERWCRLLACLLSEPGIRRLLEEEGIDEDSLRRCLKLFCDGTQRGSGRPSG